MQGFLFKPNSFKQSTRAIILNVRNLELTGILSMIFIFIQFLNLYHKFRSIKFTIKLHQLYL